MGSSEQGEHAIHTMFLEERRYPPSPEFAAQANVKADIYERDFEEFWETEGREHISWFQPFDKLYEWELPYAKWYLNGKLNVCSNCVDRHVESGAGDKVAFYWEGELADHAAHNHLFRPAKRRRSLRQRAQVDRREEGNARRDLPRDDSRAARRDARLRAPRRAALRHLRRLLGRVAGRPRQRLRGRDHDHSGRGLPPRQAARAEEDRRRGGRQNAECQEDARRHALGRRPWPGRRAATSATTIWAKDASSDPADCPCEPMDSEDLLFLMYTSGTTAKPKGIIHTTAGYLTGVATTHNYIFDLQARDRRLLLHRRQSCWYHRSLLHRIRDRWPTRPHR